MILCDACKLRKSPTVDVYKYTLLLNEFSQFNNSFVKQEWAMELCKPCRDRLQELLNTTIQSFLDSAPLMEKSDG